MQVNDPDANKSWYELREEAGLEIIDDKEEEEKMQKEEEDKEVVHIFKESKQCHEQMLRGMCVERVERNKIHVQILFLLMWKESKVPVYKVNKQVGTHVERVERNKIHVLIAILYLLVYFRNLISGKGHKMVSDGWVLFEKTAEETAPGELRQLL